MKILKWGLSCLRILVLKIRWGGRLKLEFNGGKPLYIGHRCKFYIEKNSQVEIRAGAYLAGDIEVSALGGAKVIIGRKVYIGRECCLIARESISIGEYSLLAPRVGLYDHNHNYQKNTPIGQQGFSTEAIVIGANSWLCMNSFVTKGVQFQHRIVLTANSVLNKRNVEDELTDNIQIYAGNPAKKVK